VADDVDAEPIELEVLGCLFDHGAPEVIIDVPVLPAWVCRARACGVLTMATSKALRTGV
jgi:hypothetical protein